MKRCLTMFYGLLCAASIAHALAATSPAPFELPPLMQPATSAHAGKVVWAELTTNDLGATRTFYGGLFGWTFQNIRAGDSDYAVAFLQGAPVAGLVQRRSGALDQKQALWLTFISVPSVHAASRRIIAHGGRMLVAPRSYRQRGSQAVYADPQGAVFALLHSSSGDPPDVLPAPGEWIWSALLTRDTAAEGAFYQKIFGYEIFEMSGSGDSLHLVLSSEKYARAIIDELPPEAASQHPHWIDFIRVVNTAKTVEKAKTLGGRVLVEPRRDRRGGLMAVLAGPDSAPIGVLEWNDSSSMEAAK